MDHGQHFTYFTYTPYRIRKLLIMGMQHEGGLAGHRGARFCFSHAGERSFGKFLTSNSDMRFTFGAVDGRSICATSDLAIGVHYLDGKASCS